MLVSYPRRQQASSLSAFDFHSHSLPSPPASTCIPPLTSPNLDYSPAEYSDSHDPCGAEPYDSSYTLSSLDYYMPTTPSYNPPIRVQQSTPSPGEQQAYHQSIATSPQQATASWLDFENFAHLSPQTILSQQHIYNLQDRKLAHKRHSSESTIGSGGPASPYSPVAAAFPRILDSEHTLYPSPGFDSFDHAHSVSGSYPKALPTISPITFTDSFVQPNYQEFYPSPDNAQTHLSAARQAIMAQQRSDMGDSSSISRTSYNGECEDGFKPHMDMRSSVPKLDRTMSDIYQDELYNPNITSTPSQPPQQGTSQRKVLSPARDALSQRLQAANDNHLSARSSSPSTTTASRGRSPFKPDSEFLHDTYSHTNSPTPRQLGAVAQRQLKPEPDTNPYMQQQSLEEARTISPKEALLDYSESVEESKTPLFPQDSTVMAANRQSLSYSGMKPFAPQESMQSDGGETGTQQSFNSMATTRRESSSNYSSASGFQSRSKFSNASPSNAQVPQQYPFISQSRRQNSSMRSASDQSPEFPSTLTSMESTKSDSGPRSVQEQSQGSPEIHRPSRTTADSGTYTCTYHGCTMRFETPAKLQKHKREGHRTTSPQTGSNASSASAAAALANRNSQAGPHKCERINPTTGKPCNSVFSRPYDLTRHEDTIHNSRKQKVRCQLCTEEKTFSRNDALTRHMRVVHPEVDFPGKTKRKGGT